MAIKHVGVIIGMSKDAQFGPVLMFGLGGILREEMLTNSEKVNILVVQGCCQEKLAGCQLFDRLPITGTKSDRALV